MNMCVYIYTYIFIYICMYTSIYTHIYIYTHIHTYIYIYTYIHICIHTMVQNGSIVPFIDSPPFGERFSRHAIISKSLSAAVPAASLGLPRLPAFFGEVVSGKPVAHNYVLFL